MSSPATKPLFAGYRFPVEVISHAVWLYFRFPLSLRMVEEMLAARGILVSYQVIVQLIAATTTKAGLKVRCELDTNAYSKGIKVTDAEMKTLNLHCHDFHGEWNYTIAPQSQK
jgi:transposase-like protein